MTYAFKIGFDVTAQSSTFALLNLHHIVNKSIGDRKKLFED